MSPCASYERSFKEATLNNANSTFVSSVEGYVAQLRGLACLRVGGRPLSVTNRKIFFRMFRSWLILTGDLLLSDGVDNHTIRQRLHNFCGEFLDVDLDQLFSLLDSVYESLIRDSYVCTQDFFAYFSESYSNIGRLVSPIKDVIEQIFCSTGAERSIPLRKAAQFLRFPRKLEFQDIGLEALALQEYLETEACLAAVVYDNDLLDGLNAIMREWLSNFRIDTLLPQHGTGSVAEGSLTLAQKYEAASVDTMVKVLLSDCGSGWEDYFPLRPREGLLRASRTAFVPKTVSKLRTISMEPITLQYLQQGVMYALYRFIDDHPYLGVRIRLDHQEQNQVLALEGSKFHSFGTIDLSKASDTVSWRLVRGVFKGTSLYKWLLGTRSHFTILPDGSRVRLDKFAPMGSALCFPIECLIFACIIEYVNRKRCGTSVLYSVYGDDLVVPSHLYDDTINVLSQCGFTVNRQKSFNGGNYTESCGKEYYCGVDISPLYYRIPFYAKERLSPSAFGSLCGMANNCHFHGLPILREFCINLLQDCSEQLGLGALRFVYSPYESPFLFSMNPSNNGDHCYWRKRYQVKSRRFVVVKSKQRGGEMSDDRLKYHQALVMMAKRSRANAVVDESQPSTALHGCIEFFSSCTLPCEPYVFRDLSQAYDWDGT